MHSNTLTQGTRAPQGIGHKHHEDNPVLLWQQCAGTGMIGHQKHKTSHRINMAQLWAVSTRQHSTTFTIFVSGLQGYSQTQCWQPHTSCVQLLGLQAQSCRVLPQHLMLWDFITATLEHTHLMLTFWTIFCHCYFDIALLCMATWIANRTHRSHGFVCAIVFGTHSYMEFNKTHL